MFYPWRRICKVLNPLAPRLPFFGDQHEFSPNNTKRKDDENNLQKAKFFNLLSISLNLSFKETYGDQFEEFVCRYRHQPSGAPPSPPPASLLFNHVIFYLEYLFQIMWMECL